jgi:hypothetical protein
VDNGVDNAAQGWVPPGVDTRRANPARVYDYLLGGSHNFLADQDAGRAITAMQPGAARFARANRAFLGRAVRFMAADGIRQFLDIGSGIPTQGNVHEITAEAAPGAHVVYADIDPIAVAHSEAILSGTDDAVIVPADLRSPQQILGNAEVRRLIDFGQPVAVLLVFVLHFVSDADHPRELVARLRDALAPGSYLVLSHATSDDQPATAQVMKKMYDRTVSTSIVPRPHEEILRFFDGFTLVDPGLVPVPEWRPESPPPKGFWGSYAGVGKKAG